MSELYSYSDYLGMTSAQQKALRNMFESDADFLTWLNQAKIEYDSMTQPDAIEMGGDKIEVKQ